MAGGEDLPVMRAQGDLPGKEEKDRQPVRHGIVGGSVGEHALASCGIPPNKRFCFKAILLVVGRGVSCVNSLSLCSWFAVCFVYRLSFRDCSARWAKVCRIVVDLFASLCSRTRSRRLWCRGRHDNLNFRTMSTFGTLFRVTTYGESHGASVGAIVDGCPPGLSLTAADIQVQLSRRRPGQTNLTTPRNEKDAVHLQSGTEMGVTLGTPIGLLVKNEDQRPHDYSETDSYPRPSHADYTYLEKYGIKASSGGGRSSARETIGRVAAGAIAEKYLKLAYGVEIVAFVSSVGKLHLPASLAPPSLAPTHPDEEDDSAHDALTPEFVKLLATITRDDVDKHPTRCPHLETAERMTKRILRAKEAQDSIGGTITCVIRNAPSGLGEPVFDKFEAALAHAMLSIPATKAFEIGSGFKGTEVPGSQHNDAFVRGENGRLRTVTNWSGGIQGGITNGESIYFRIGFKSPATISQAQETAQYDGTPGSLAARGRHDPCVVPRAVPIVEAMAAIVVMDQLLIQNSRKVAASLLPPITTLPATMVMPKKAV